MRRKKRLLFDVLDDVIEPRDRYDRATRKKPRVEKTQKRAKRRDEVDAAANRKAAKAKEREKQRRADRESARSPAGEGGVQLSYGMLGAVLFVLVVVVGVSYKFGLTHGESGVFSREDRDVPTRKTEKRGRDVAHFSIQAAALPYTRATRDACVEKAVEYVTFLKGQGIRRRGRHRCARRECRGRG